MGVKNVLKVEQDVSFQVYRSRARSPETEVKTLKYNAFLFSVIGIVIAM